MLQHASKVYSMIQKVTTRVRISYALLQKQNTKCCKMIQHVTNMIQRITKCYNTVYKVVQQGYNILQHVTHRLQHVTCLHEMIRHATTCYKHVVT